MNYFQRKRSKQVEHPVNLDDFADRLNAIPPLERRADEFAPQEEPVEPVEHVGSFRDLPLSDIDDKMEALTIAYNEAKARHQATRDLIMRLRADELALIERACKVTALHSNAFAAMSDGIAALYAPKDERPEYVKPAITEVTKDEAA